MAPLCAATPHNYLVWAPLLSTRVILTMFLSERSPGFVRTQILELQEHGVAQDMIQHVNVLFLMILTLILYLS